MKIKIAQLNLTIGDIEANVNRVIKVGREAADAKCQMVVFPELTLTGYYPGDLLTSSEFIKRVELGVSAILSASQDTLGLYWVVGVAEKHPTLVGKFYNKALVIKEGTVVLDYAKQLLPTYNVFDERRHFEPGEDVAKVLDIYGTKVGFLICEDGWNDSTERTYNVNPFDTMGKAKPDLVVSINASPSNIGKRLNRHKVFNDAAVNHNLPILYVNQVGGHDQMVYDGASFAIEPSCGVVFEANRFVEDTSVVEFNNGKFTADSGKVEVDGLGVNEFYRKQIVLGLQDYARRCGFKKAVVGSSGGIDSALTLALAVEALGAENVIAITMPSAYSSTGSVSDSVKLCENLGVTLLTHPIGELVADYSRHFSAHIGTELKGLALENLQARIRGNTLMEYSNTFGNLVLTTGNKSEISVGYFTLYGDSCGGLNLIGDLYKTEVFELSKHLNKDKEVIPWDIITKEPSAELAPDQRDSDSLPPYPQLDGVLKVLIEEGQLNDQELAEATAIYNAAGDAVVNRVRKLISFSEYKRKQAAPIIRVRGRAFGSGRQIPITAKQW